MLALFRDTMALKMVLLAVAAGIVWAGIALATRLRKRQLPSTSPITPEADQKVARSVARFATLTAVVGNVPLLGMPGAAFLGLAEPIARLWCTQQGIDSFAAGGGWPAAMFLTVLWPALWPLLYCGIRMARGRLELAVTSFAAVVVALGFGTGFAVLVFVLNC